MFLRKAVTKSERKWTCRRRAWLARHYEQGRFKYERRLSSNAGEVRIATLVFKALNDLAPPYLVDDCNLVSDDIRRLRSAVSFTCALPRTRTRLGDRSFAVVGPRVWNCLPAALRAVEDYEQFRSCHLTNKGVYIFVRLGCGA